MITDLDVIKVTIKLFEERGVDFSILDVAKMLRTSKRTIYEHFKGKNQMIAKAIDYVFEDIKNQHEQIILEDISYIQKLKKIVLVYPKVINLEQVKIDKIIETHKEIYEQIDKHFADNWELTLDVFQKCKDAGEIDSKIDKNVFRIILLGIFQNVIVYRNHEKLLEEAIDIVFKGLL